MTLIGRPFSFHGHCKPARHGAILFSTEEYRKEILVFKVGSSHVAAGVFNFLGGTVETLNHLVLNAPTEDTSALHWRENGPYK